MCVVIETILAVVSQAWRLASLAVPLVWKHRRNWDYAVRLFPEKYAPAVQAARAIATFGMRMHFYGDPADLPRGVHNLIHSELEHLYVDCDFVAEL